MRIVLVDDNPIVRQTLIKYINRLEGVEIAGQAGTVQEATRLMQTVQPDVAILDYKLSDGTAVEILTELKNQQLEMITLILTNYGTEPYRRVCINAGADYFYHKTHDFQNLFDQLEEISQSNDFQ
jgi:DNA-binding NarL/FixJ family response regulator